jgi:hypothetical protein
MREVLDEGLRNKTSAAERRPDILSRLGGALFAAALTEAAPDPTARRAGMEEAEKLLLEGQAGMDKERSVKPLLRRDGLERLVRFYESSGDDKKAAAWRNRRGEFDRTHAEPGFAAVNP